MVTGWIQKFLNCAKLPRTEKRELIQWKKYFEVETFIEVNDEKQVGYNLIIVERN